jgi:maltodextrin utilization protein YvdJ
MVIQKPLSSRNLWFERFMAITATINLGLVVFDLSYIPWRDFYLRHLPDLTRLYDPIKGIQPHRETEAYLAVVEAAEKQVSQMGLQSNQAEATLDELRRLSTEIIDTNPFALADKSGTLEKIKNRMRDRTREKSAKKAFAKFWSQSYLTQKGWSQEIEFFNRRIRPLIATNYYRQIGENGEFLDKFYLIDLPFTLIFGLELLIRSFFIKRRHPEFSWLEAIIWHWYNLLLIIPFWRTLRVIPVVIHLDKARIINFQSIRTQIHRGIVSNFAEELTEIIVVRVINQIQGSVKRGELTRWLLQKESIRPYIEVNNVNEVEAISKILVQTIIYQVFPKIQPEITAILRHNINGALNQTPIYKNLQALPGVGLLQNQIAEQMASQIATNLYSAIVSAVEDPVSAKLSSQLVQRFTDTLGAEMQEKHVIAEVQSLIFDFLEEVKLNYVQRLSQEDIQQIVEQMRKIKVQATVQNAIVKRVGG